MADGLTDDANKEILLTEAVNELKKQLQELNEKKREGQQKLKDIKSKIDLTHEAEHESEKRMREILQEAEAKHEELLNEENRLLGDKAAAESRLLKVKEKLAKIAELNKKIEGGDDD